MQLQEIKKQIDTYKLELDECQILIEKREDLLQKIHELKQNIEENLIKRASKQSQELDLQISDESEQVTNLKKKLREIDQRLDQIGEEKENIFNDLRDQLIKSIQTQYPNAKKEYLKLSKELDEAKSQHTSCIELKNRLAPFTATLKEGAQIDLKGGVLLFLLGNNPKAKLARSIQKAAKYAKEITPQVQHPRFLTYFEKFEKEASKTWNRALYKGQFTALFVEYSTLMTELEEQITHLSRKIIESEKAIEIWIEKHCQP